MKTYKKPAVMDNVYKCPSCKSEFKLNDSDLPKVESHVPTDRMDEQNEGVYVTCPECNGRVKVPHILLEMKKNFMKKS